jgi:hypothetical protein
LGLEFYKEVAFESKIPAYLAICANSLQKLEMVKPYDIIIIDESEQVIQHLVGDTFKPGKRRAVIPVLHRLLRQAKQVVCLDADMSLLTLNTITQARKNDGLDDEWTFVKNDYKPEISPVLNLYESRQPLLDDFIDDALAGKKVMLTSNSKTRIDDVYALINDRCEVIKITSETSGDEESQQFLKNLQHGKLDKRVLLFTPSVGTGVDIQIPFDAVYGLFESRVNTHYDFDQQIHRVRHTAKTAVWIDSNIYSNESNPEVIKHSLIQNDEATKHLINYKIADAKSNWFDWLLDLYSEVLAYSNSSMNALCDNFVNLKKSQGWSIELTSKTEEYHYQDELKLMRQTNRDEFKMLLRSALSIDILEFNELKRKPNKTLEERYSCIRYEIEYFFKQTIEENPDLAEWWLDGLDLDIIKYERFISDDEIERDLDEQESTIVDRQHHTQRKALLKKAFEILGLLNDEGFDCRVTMEKNETKVQKFSGWAGALSDAQQMVLGFNTSGKSIEKEPFKVVKMFLDKVGLKTGCTRKQCKVDGRKKSVYFHQISDEHLRLILKYMELRQLAVNTT